MAYPGFPLRGCRPLGTRLEFSPHSNLETFYMTPYVPCSTLNKLVGDTERKGCWHIRRQHMNPNIFGYMLNIDQVMGERERKGCWCIRHRYMNIEIFGSMFKKNKLWETEREVCRHIRHCHMNIEIFGSMFNNEQVVGGREKKGCRHIRHHHMNLEMFLGTSGISI